VRAGVDEHHAFRLEVQPCGDGQYALQVLQAPLSQAEASGDAFEPVVRVWAVPLAAVMDHVLAAVRSAGYKPSDLRRSRSAPFKLDERDGVRLGLLFLAVKPLRKLSRIEAVSRGVGGMEFEELYYWYSKSTGANGGARACHALRVLLAEE